MAERGTQQQRARGPGNKALATTLLEALAVRGRSAAVERGRRALEATGADLTAAAGWLSDDAIARLFAAAEVEPGLSRAIGHRLVAADATGLALYGLGLATPEKAYRRVQSLLPREAPHSSWEVEGIDEGRARLAYRPLAPAATRSSEALCALRRGMLEAVPGLYGLLPAAVDESACVARGADVCRYVVRWQASPRRATWMGLAAGLGVSAGAVSGSVFLGGVPLVAGGVTATGMLVVGALLLAPLVGVVIDLRRQLEAVAGARRGQLALFDQVDDALAEKLDALARADARLDADPAPSPVRSNAPSDRGRSEEESRALRHALHEIHVAAGELECFFDAQDDRAGRAGEISEERGRVRDIRESVARIARGADEEGWRASIDLPRLVERAIASARPGLARGTTITFDADPELAPLECEPVQIEHVVVQLIKNAVEASVGLSDAPQVAVALRETPAGVELSVEDRGVGIESTAIDEVFDPFFGDRPAGAAQGLGLPVCLRIAERHGGALRIENQARAGTRVTVLLPRDEKGLAGPAEAKGPGAPATEV